jgi:hypothetical protein
MRFRWCLQPIAFGLVLLTVVFPSTASAQTTPPGPYNETCQNIQMKGSTLHAKCQTADGKLVDAKLNNADKCSDGVINLNGILSCQAGLIPPGSYVQGCADVRLEVTTLKANCKNNKDTLVATELKNANQCKGDIANQNGALKCVATAQPAAQDKQDKQDKPEKKKKKKFIVF